MTAPRRSDIRNSLARHLGRTASTADELTAMRQAAWMRQGVAVLRPEDINDDWERQVVVNIATKLYGKREG